jgi:two-component system response regulator AgrA
MIPVYICEDDAQQLKVLKNLVVNIVNDENFDNIKLVCTTKYPTEILEKMNDNEIALYLLDIELGDAEMSGLDLASKIRRRNAAAWIIMITAYNFALNTYKMQIGVKDYIIKGEPEAMSLRLKKYLRELQDSTHLAALNNEIYLQVDGTFKIKVDDIYYIAALADIKRKVDVRSKTGSSVISTTLKELISQNDTVFFQCGRSYLINIKNVKKIDRFNNCVIMANDDKIPIPPRQIKTLERRLLTHLH